ncbi:DUF4179 domain-containing protein [Bacillus sp. FJAT-22090]|uniref:DUF4179 domain-containing protein n=1 Tax=Bacillus sp. FJAT-22090 TaxID=1581038 RepID=UPI00119CB9D5|nr:DUF4179 domain-containing protein [Bacillus sp. FJAT-22090]
MNCPKADKLSQYVDILLTEQERDEILAHIKSCEDCSRIVEVFQEEQRFLKETLQTPTLPDDFASIVLEQLEPYKQKAVRRKRKPWKRLMVIAAGIVLAIGLTTTLSPSFADWIGGFFSSDQADEGLRMAMDAGLVERVNQEVTDQGVTFKVEDVIVDSSRVALSYQVLDKNGKPQDTYLNPIETKNVITVFDQNGKELPGISGGWWEGSDYGYTEVSLRGQEGLENIMIKFDLVKLNGVSGSWKLEVPVDLKEMNKLTKTIPLNDQETSNHGVAINMEKVQFSPSSSELLYETSFTKEEYAKVANDVQKLKEKFGEEIINDIGKYGTAIQYHIENEEKKTLYYHNNYLADEKDPNNLGMLQSSGEDTEQLGKVAWNDSFIPQQEESKLNFVLDGVIKTVPSDFSITFKPKEVKKHPISFAYEGNYITIKTAKKQSEFSLRKSLLPIEKETFIKIEMEGGREELAPELGWWVLEDDKGKVYKAYGSDSILNEKDKNNRYKTTIDLTSHELEEVPDELTLHLVSVTRYEKVKDKWTVPLY